MTIRRPANSQESSPRSAYGVSANANEHRPDILRIEIGARTISFPLHALSRWESTSGAKDQILLRLPDAAILVTGRNLAVIHSALDRGELRVLRIGLQGEVAIQSIDVRAGTRRDG